MVSHAARIIHGRKETLLQNNIIRARAVLSYNELWATVNTTLHTPDRTSVIMTLVDIGPYSSTMQL